MSTTPAPISEAGQKKPDFSLFEQHQSKFRELYLEQNKSLAQVKVEMETSHGFPATDAKIYEYGLRHLGFIKKLPIEGWIEVDVCAKKRKVREGKETEVYLSGPTPDWPEGVVLKTPPLSPNMIVTTLQSNVTRIPTSPSTVSTHSLGIYSINIRPSSGFQLELSSNDVWARMLSNPSSTVHLLSKVPSNQLMDMLRQTIGDGLLAFQSKESYEIDALSIPSQSLHPHHIIPTPQLRRPLGNDSHYVGVTTQAQTQSTEALGKLCIMLANGDMSQITDQRDCSLGLGIDTNKPALKAFFALDLPAVATMWGRLILLSRRFDSGNAFRTLVEVGFETHNGEWIRQHATVLIQAAAGLGSKKIGKIARRLLSRGIVRHTRMEYLEPSLLDIIEHRDVEMMLMFSGAGIIFDNVNSITCYSRFHKISRSLLSSTQRQQWAEMLKVAGFDFDCFIGIHTVIYNVFVKFDATYDRQYDRNFGNPYGSCFYFDALWLSGEYELYDAVVCHSKKAKTQATISGLVMTAHRGAEPLLFYIHSKQVPEHTSQQRLLEIALSVAAGLGSVAAIQSFREAGIDPNVPLLLRENSYFQLDWHPLMRAAAGKHLKAVRALIEMGAETRLDIRGFNPLSAAVWRPKPLFGKRRLEQLETVRYFLDKGLAHEYGPDAIIKAVTPPYNDTYGFGVTQDAFVADEEIIDILLQAGTKLDQILVEGKDILHNAIDRGCNLKTVEILLRRGSRVHSRPYRKGGETMLHSAAASSSADSQQIVELLLSNGASCTDECGGLSILESCLPIREGIVGKAERARRLQLFSFLLARVAQVNDSKERLESGRGRWASILIRLLEYNAPDEVIYLIIETGVNIDLLALRNREFYTPLQLAAYKGRLNVAYWLVNRGANINAGAGQYGHTALQAACNPDPDRKIDLNLVKFLIDNGADVNARGISRRATALQCAIIRGSMAVFCLLLDAGANVHTASGDKSVLDTAAEYGRLDMVDMLIRKGAQSFWQEDSPYSGAIDNAMRRGHFAIAKMLRELPG
ncbi:hypothetical protein CIB48_g424 [Xylaria polymorpha]|nr:hypothetical protein CIB48_g424 [Xylaria polymorpha]